MSSFSWTVKYSLSVKLMNINLIYRTVKIKEKSFENNVLDLVFFKVKESVNFFSGNTRAELLKILGISKPEECSKGQKHLVTQYADFINDLDDSGEAFPIFNGLYVNEPVGKLNSPRDANPLYLK